MRQERLPVENIEWEGNGNANVSNRQVHVAPCSPAGKGTEGWANRWVNHCERSEHPGKPPRQTEPNGENQTI